MFLTRTMEKLETTTELDNAVETVDGVVSRVLPDGPLRDVLHGSWLGHRLHPLLVAMPIGLNVGATLLDLLGDEGDRRAATVLQGTAVACAVPTALTGAADFAAVAARGPKRVGLVHGAAAVESTLWFGGALAARLTGHHRTASGLTLTGLAALAVAGYLGGHLAYVDGVGVKAADVGGVDAVRVPTDRH